jgi:hypothetical protein
MDPTKNYIKLAGQELQEIEYLNDYKLVDNAVTIRYRPVPPPEKSLEEEVMEEIGANREEISKEKNPFDVYLAIALRILERKLKALKEQR